MKRRRVPSFRLVSNFEFRISSFLPAVLALTVPAPALAHLMNTGFGPFYDGLTHLVLTPEDLLPVVALTLLAGLRGPRGGRAVLFVLPLAWLTGCMAASLISAHATLSRLAVALIIALGALVAADLPLPVPSLAGVAIALGLLNGGLNGVELAGAPGRWLGAAGISSALFLVVSLLAGQVASLRTPWARVAVRVAGSWIAAIGLLMLGWSIRGI